jgi:hypothetical protein
MATEAAVTRKGGLAAQRVWETGQMAWPASLRDRPRSRIAEVLVVSLVALFVGGCGGLTEPSKSSVSGPTGGSAIAAHLTPKECSSEESSASSTNESSAGGRELRRCEFVLPGHQAFNCNMASLQKSTPTGAEVEHSKACVPVVRVPTAPAAVAAAIARARACFAGEGLAVHGGSVPPEGHGPGGPEGELITGGALIAFYADPHVAKQAEAAVLREAHRLSTTIDRHDAVTVFWLVRRPPPELGGRVERCAFK